MTTTIKGQLSIEYLILLSILLGLFAIIASVSLNLFQIGVFAIDVKNAQLFSNELEKNINFLSFLSDGSRKKIIANPQTNWKLLFDDGLLFIKVESADLNQKKTMNFQPVLAPQIFISTIKPRTEIILEKQGYTILIKQG